MKGEEMEMKMEVRNTGCSCLLSRRGAVSWRGPRGAAGTHMHGRCDCAPEALTGPDLAVASHTRHVYLEAVTGSLCR